MLDSVTCTSVDFLAIEHQPRLVTARSVVEHGAQDFAFGCRQELADRSAEYLLERQLHQVGETLVAVDDVAGDRERGRAFLHALDQRAIGRIGAAQREYASLAVLVGQQQRVDLAAVDGLQVALRLQQAGAQFLDIEIVDAHAGTTSRSPRPAITRARFDMSPIMRRSGSGPFLTSVGVAKICSSRINAGC